MPIITVQMAKGRTKEQKLEFIKKVTELTVDVMKTTPSAVTVIMQEYEGENCATGGIHNFGKGEK